MLFDLPLMRSGVFREHAFPQLGLSSAQGITFPAILLGLISTFLNSFPVRPQGNIKRHPEGGPGNDEQKDPEDSDTQTQEERGRTGLGRIFASFSHRNYQLYYIGHGTSLIGTWMQVTAEGWLVYQLTNSPLALGLVRFLHAIPVTLFTIPGGAFADRFDKRRILLATQTLSMTLAFVLFGLVYTERIEVWHVGLLGMFLGFANAFDIPARQSFIIDIVGKKDLMNAIVLNSSMFNGARIVGPALAGLLISFAGMATCFLVNAFSFLAVILSYLCMKLPKTDRPPLQKSMRHETMEAVRFVRANKNVASVLVLVATASVFGICYVVLLPVFAKDILHVGPGGYGYLMTSNGIGALLGAFALASFGDRFSRKSLLYTGILGFSTALLFFALSRHFWLTSFLLACAGWFMILFFSTANTIVQLATPDSIRGRVMGIYSFCFIGLSPFGGLFAGVNARMTSAVIAVVFSATVCILVTLVLWWNSPNDRNPFSPNPKTHQKD
jgi:MFS family permease